MFYITAKDMIKEKEMNIPATNSAIDVAYWFLTKAESNGTYIDDDKLQHLLFLAQCKYAQKFGHKMLMPCVFVCEQNGFFEPNIKKLFSNGRPFMVVTKFDDDLSNFFNHIWSDFGKFSTQELNRIVTETNLFQKTFKKGCKTVLTWNSLIDNSDEYGTINSSYNVKKEKKVLISQNGPVVVSKWTPRKVIK